MVGMIRLPLFFCGADPSIGASGVWSPRNPPCLFGFPRITLSKSFVSSSRLRIDGPLLLHPRMA